MLRTPASRLQCNLLAVPQMLFLLLELTQNSQRKKSKLQWSDHSGIVHLLCHHHDKRHFGLVALLIDAIVALVDCF